MTQATVSSKFQVVIPKDLRQQVPIRRGQRVTLLAKNGVIYVVPNVPLKSLRGTLKGVPLAGFREKKDRL